MKDWGAVRLRERGWLNATEGRACWMTTCRSPRWYPGTRITSPLCRDPEEPVSPDDLAGLAEVRGLLDVDVAAGEYGYSPHYFARMIAAHAVDCIQIDATRCGGYTAWLAIAHSAAAACLSVSAHCAPHLHAVAAASVANLRHVEYFHDHVRIEHRLFAGLPVLHDGGLLVGASPGHGMELRQQPAEPFRVA